MTGAAGVGGVGGASGGPGGPGVADAVRAALARVQDPEIRRVVVGMPVSGGADACQIDVRFDNAGTPRRIRFMLVRENGTWKIDDMHYGDMNSDFEFAPLQTQLNSWIADAKAGAAG